VVVVVGPANPMAVVALPLLIMAEVVVVSLGLEM
jgi:hypothetical protein